MIQKKSCVKIKPLGTICEYLHGLSGFVVKTRKKIITKRTYESNWNPVKVGETTEYCVDLSAHSNRELDTSMPKQFWFEAEQLTEV